MSSVTRRRYDEVTRDHFGLSNFMSAAASLDYTYRYRFPSRVEHPDDGVLGLRLATFGGEEPNPHFFEGHIAQPQVVAETLITLSNIVRTHFFLPTAALQRDPVVTCSDDVLRFECFSGCCGVYVRVDFTSTTFDTPIIGRGTTNVDFNTPLRSGLAQLRTGRDAALAIGADELQLQVDDAEFVEKKVKLPIRWIKCFSEVQAYLPTLQQRMEIAGADFLRFLRGLPRDGARNRPAWVTPAGRGLRLSQREQRDSIRVMGTDRLKVLQTLATSSRNVHVWSDDGAGISAWELLFETGRFLLVLSPDLFRGFSGEGQVLQTLACDDWQSVLASVRAELTWNTHIDANDVAARCELTSDQVTAALAALGARGLVGFDPAAGKFFHRELPFDLEQVEALQPRLKNARKVLAENKVRLHQRIDAERVELLIQGNGTEHLVKLAPEQDRCTCPWYSKHHGERGPCKHVLAARLFLEGEQHEV